jgi:hypothetical protein
VVGDGKLDLVGCDGAGKRNSTVGYDMKLELVCPCRRKYKQHVNKRVPKTKHGTTALILQRPYYSTYEITTSFVH